MIDGRIEMTKFNFVQQCIHEIMLQQLHYINNEYIFAIIELGPVPQ